MAVSSLQLVDNISVTNTASYSQAVNMNSANALQVTVVVAAAGGTTLTMSLEGSNDLSNWASITVAGSWATLGAGFSAPASVSSIAYQYVRVKFLAAAAGPLVCSVYLCTSFL